MIGSARIVGLGLMILSVMLLIAFLGWGGTALFSGETSSGGMTLGILLSMMVLAPIFGIGFFLMRRGQNEERQFADVKQEKKLLNMVLTQGQVNMAELVTELHEPRERVEDMIRDLVGKQLFNGAINWDKGILYSVESQSLTDNGHCPNCGGEVAFAGKGVIACQWCGSEVFLTKRAAASTTMDATEEQSS